MQYINIHTHHPPHPNELVIQNLYHQFEKVEQQGRFSVGLHPWYINENWRNDFEQLQRSASHPNVKAIGE